MSRRILLLVLLCAHGLFAADPEPPGYRTILWIGDEAYAKPEKVPLFFQRLREMGINTGMVHGDAPFEPVWTNGFPYYVENIVNKGLCLKFNSTVKDWGAFVNGWIKSRSTSAFVRDYSLDDPVWKSWANGQVKRLVEKNRGNHPVAYDLRDELSVTISANPFDYDFGPITLAAFRDWLKTQYPTLDALNAGWETTFATWAEVRPFTTDQIKNRMASGDARPRGGPDWQALAALRFDPSTARSEPTRWNFSPWADFRTYLDISLARTLDELRGTAHAADPRTPVGIEGTQMPSAFGGYDLWRLSQSLDWIEPYDIGNAREILGSFMGRKLLMTTVFEGETGPARRRLWHLLLEGDRGCIVWWSNDCVDMASPDYRLTKKGEALAPVLKELASPLASLFMEAQRVRDPIAIHYSQPSIQVDWLLGSMGDGSSWPRRFSSYEAANNRLVKVRNSWLKAFQDLGCSPRFVSSQQIEEGVLDREKFLGVVLPGSLALSDRESAALVRYLQANESRLIFADGTPGVFDERGRTRKASPIFKSLSKKSEAESSVTTKTGSMRRAGDIAGYEKDRAEEGDPLAWARWINGLTTNWVREVRVPLEARVRVHRFRSGSTRLLAFERNVQYRMSEDLKEQKRGGAFDQAVKFEAKLAAPAHVYDLRTSRYLGLTDTLSLSVDPWEPTLLALTETPLAPGDVVAQVRKAAGRHEEK